MQLTRSIHRFAAIGGKRIATICDGRANTWSEFADRVARVARGLRDLGVGTGDRVALLSLNSDYYLEYFFGAMWAGGCIVPLNTRWSVQENRYAIDDAGAVVLVVDDHFLGAGQQLRGQCGLVRHLIHAGAGSTPQEAVSHRCLVEDSKPCVDARRGGEDLAGIFYTGGTTGLPKGVMVPHRGLISSSLSLLPSTRLNEDSVLLHIAPMFHMADTSFGVATTLAGGSHVMLSGFQPVEVFQTIERHRITTLPLVPTILKILIEHPEWDKFDLSSLSCIGYGGAPITETLLRDSMARLGQCRFVQCYGQTELSPIATLLEPQYHTLEGPDSGHLQTAGRATTMSEVMVIAPNGNPAAPGEVGEITVAGPMAMLGYWNKPEETRNALVDGWVRTGDAGFLDTDGFLHVVDRLKDMIISGGENIYSVEVENALAKHPSVSSCVVIGLPDPVWGEAVLAVVVLRDGMTATESELIEHCRDLIGHYKCPRSVKFRDGMFPLSGAGKILKRLVRDEYLPTDIAVERTARG